MPEESQGSGSANGSAAAETGGPSSSKFGSPKQAATAQRILTTPGRGEESESSSPEAKVSENGDQAKQPEVKQRESRYARTRRLKQELRQRETALSQRETQIAQAEREKKAPKKPQYTVEELKEYRASWDAEGKYELVEKADKEIARLEKLEGEESHETNFVNEWHQAEADLAKADPEFMKSGTRLDSKLREIMQGQDGQIYRQHPRGIVAAYHRAKMEILDGDHKEALGKIQQLEQELERVTGLTSIGGGAPTKPGGQGRVENLKDFSKLSSAEMKKRLQSSANRSSNLSPWL